MADCATSLTALALQCGGGLQQAGITRLYAIAYGDLQNITGTDEPYAYSTNGLVNNINVQTGKNFVEVGVLKNTSGLVTDTTIDRLTMTGSVKNTFTLVIPGMNQTNSKWIESLFNQPLVFIMKIPSGKYFVVGLNGDLMVDSSTGGTGITGNEMQGNTVTLSSTESRLTPQVDDSIIADLLGL
ncbi:MAG: hypothetical protein EOO43_09555 [Flavobacterium sp.]|nr:MAG: hypothetical protein EOO43_09555 [Flavobacterium sp.]